MTTLARRPLVSLVRRSWGLYAMVPLLLLEVLNHSDRVESLIGFAPSVLDSSNGVLIIVNPLVAALTCAETLVLTRGPRWEAITSLPDDGIRLLAGRVAATAGWIAALHVVCVIYAVGKSVLTTSSTLPPAWPIVPALMSILAFGALGALIARAWPSMVAPPLTAVGLYILTLMIKKSLPDPLVQFGGATELLLGLRNRLDVLALQAVWLTVIAIAAIVLAVGTMRGYPRVGPRAVACLAAVACAALALASLGDLRFETTSTSLVCKGAQPQVCVVADFSDQLDTQYTLISGAAREMSVLGAALPSRFEEGTAAREDRQGDVAYFSIYHVDPDTGLDEATVHSNLILDFAESVACRTRVGVKWAEVQKVSDWAALVHENPSSRGTAREVRLREQATDAMGRIQACA